MNYKEWLNIWLENYVKPSAKARTIDSYERIIQKQISESLGKMELMDITAMDIQLFVTELLKSGNRATKKGLAASSVNTVITVIQSSLKTAMILGYIHKNVAEGIKRPKIKGKEITCFSIQEQKKIEQAVLTDNRSKMFGVVLCLYIIPHGVLNIEYNAFVGCINLIDINLPEGLEKIGDYAFCGCEKLNVVTIPNETISIGEYAFADCTNVSQINIGISVNKIGSYAFASCKSLTSIYIPNSVIEIERYAFWNCQNLERIDVSAENENYRSIAGDLYEKKGEKLVQYAIGKKEESISLPDGIRTIGEYAFSCCVYIKSITIFDEMIYVEIGAFSGCTNLSEVNYKGTEEQWNNIAIGRYNENLTNAKRNYI